MEPCKPVAARATGWCGFLGLLRCLVPRPGQWIPWSVPKVFPFWVRREGGGGHSVYHPSAMVSHFLLLVFYKLGLRDLLVTTLIGFGRDVEYGTPWRPSPPGGARLHPRAPADGLARTGRFWRLGTPSLSTERPLFQEPIGQNTLAPTSGPIRWKNGLKRFWQPIVTLSMNRRRRAAHLDQATTSPLHPYCDTRGGWIGSGSHGRRGGRMWTPT